MNEREILKKLEAINEQFNDGFTDQKDICIFVAIENDNGFTTGNWIITEVDLDSLMIICDYEELRDHYKFGDFHPSEQVTFEYNNLLKEWECSDNYTMGFLHEKDFDKWWVMRKLNNYEEQLNKVEKWKAEAIKEYEDKWGRLR